MLYHVYVYFNRAPLVDGYETCLSYTDIRARSREGAIRKALRFTEVVETSKKQNLEIVEVQEAGE